MTNVYDNAGHLERLGALARENEDLKRRLAELEKQQPVPVEAIGRLLTEAMDEAVENGASSVSMPDDYVAVAAWLCRVEGADNG